MLAYEAQAVLTEILANSEIDLADNLSITKKINYESDYMIVVTGFIGYIHKTKILDIAKNHGLEIDEKKRWLELS